MVMVVVTINDPMMMMVPPPPQAWGLHNCRSVEATSDTGLIKTAAAAYEQQPSYFPVVVVDGTKETFSYNLKGKARTNGDTSHTTFIQIQTLLSVQYSAKR